MKTYVALLRGVNVGGNNMIAMADLRRLLATLGFVDAKTLLQSGNAVFRGAAATPAKVEALLEAALTRRIGLTADIHVRTAAELDAAIAANPLRAEAASDPGHLIVSFFKTPLDAGAVKAAQAAIRGPEVLRADGRHLYTFFPAGMGNSKAVPIIDRTLGVRGTGRNWNTVLKLAALAKPGVEA